MGKKTVKKMHKRGVSPLIATVLLIAFAVALGAVVMNWGRTYAQDTQDKVQKTADEDLACTLDVDLEVVILSSGVKLCYGGSGTDGYIQATLKNTGKKAIISTDISIIGASGVYNNQSVNSSDIAPGLAMFLNITYDYSTYGKVEQIRFIPKIVVRGVETLCATRGLERDQEDILNCSA